MNGNRFIQARGQEHGGHDHIMYLGLLLPNFSNLFQPPFLLLSAKMPFVCNCPQEEAFSKWKAILLTGPLVGIHDANKTTVLTADTTSHWLGAVTSRENEDGTHCVTAYAPQAVTDIEGRYAKIEKEHLTLARVCEKFRDCFTQH